MRDYDAWIAFIASRETVPFDWDGNNCGAYAGGAILALTGRDPMPELNVRSEREARRLVLREGGMEALVNKRLRPIDIGAAQRGDLAGVADDAFGIRLMVIEGETLVSPGDRGNRRGPRSAMIRAWSAT